MIGIRGCFGVVVWGFVFAGGGFGEEGASEPTPPGFFVPPSELLPPVLSWEGASRALALAPDHPWVTPCEASGFERTSRYEETMAWLERLVSASEDLRMIRLAKSPEGRDLVLILASKEPSFTPEALRRSGKPIVLAQACIHAGEVDGKDAGMMLLRDLTVRGTKKELLDGAHFLFIPMLNVDGHERFSAFARVNQRGPVEMGWRTTARNLNLNRDYAKADSWAMQALLRALNAWTPHLYLDLHVTDGADYQYDITFGFNRAHGYSPKISRWLEEKFTPAVNADLQEHGHIPGPLVFAADSTDMSAGLFDWTASPRFSNGYGDAVHLPTVLVENHSLKPYDQRVLGTYVLLESTLRVIADHFDSLRSAIGADRARRPARLPLSFSVPRDQTPPTMEFLGIESRLRESATTGGNVVEWLGKPITMTVPVFAPTAPAVSVDRPRAYWIPPAWEEVLERLSIHGIEMETFEDATEIDLTMTRLVTPTLATSAFEGRVRVSSKYEAERVRVRFPPGTRRVSTDQPKGDLAMLLLEPQSQDSFFQWGFFLEVLQRTEYIEAYALAPLGERMLREDPRLREEFERKVAEEEEFRDNPRRRLQWLYARSAYFDRTWNLYPIGREEAASKDRPDGE